MSDKELIHYRMIGIQMGIGMLWGALRNMYIENELAITIACGMLSVVSCAGSEIYYYYKGKER
jgi:hypothetical protein